MRFLLGSRGLSWLRTGKGDDRVDQRVKRVENRHCGLHFLAYQRKFGAANKDPACAALHEGRAFVFEDRNVSRTRAVLLDPADRSQNCGFGFRKGGTQTDLLVACLETNLCCWSRARPESRQMCPQSPRVLMGFRITRFRLSTAFSRWARMSRTVPATRAAAGCRRSDGRDRRACRSSCGRRRRVVRRVLPVVSPCLASARHRSTPGYDTPGGSPDSDD